MGDRQVRPPPPDQPRQPRRAPRQGRSLAGRRGAPVAPHRRVGKPKPLEDPQRLPVLPRGDDNFVAMSFQALDDGSQDKRCAAAVQSTQTFKRSDGGGSQLGVEGVAVQQRPGPSASASLSPSKRSERAAAITAAISRKSSSRKPRIAGAGVPIRTRGDHRRALVERHRVAVHGQPLVEPVLGAGRSTRSGAGRRGACRCRR